MNRTHQTLLGLLFVGCFGCRNGGEEAAGPLPVEPLTDLVVEKVAEDLRENIHAVPAWMYPLIETITRRLAEDHSENASDIERAKGDHAEDVH